LLSTADPLADWRALGAQEVDCEIVDGSHEGIFRSPNVEGLARRLQDKLRQARGQG
jgi:hypothetical protein